MLSRHSFGLFRKSKLADGDFFFILLRKFLFFDDHLRGKILILTNFFS